MADIPGLVPLGDGTYRVVGTKGSAQLRRKRAIRDPGLGERLRDLEETDPAVKAARERLDEVTSPHETWRRSMVARVWNEEKPC